MKYINRETAQSLIKTYGFSLFPVHGITLEGDCTCGNKDCTNKGKHPATKDGFKSATKDIDELISMYKGKKCLNAGIATGKESGVFVIDIDSEEGLKNFE